MSNVWLSVSLTRSLRACLVIFTLLHRCTTCADEAPFSCSVGCLLECKRHKMKCDRTSCHILPWKLTLCPYVAKESKYLWSAVRGNRMRLFFLLLICLDHWVTDGLEWFFCLRWVLTKHFYLPPFRTWAVQSRRIKERLLKNNKLQQPWKCGIQCFSAWTEMEVMLDYLQ